MASLPNTRTVTYEEWLPMRHLPRVFRISTYLSAPRSSNKTAIFTPHPIEAWVFSPEARNVEVLLLENGQLRRSQVLADGILQPKLFPHVHVDIAQIWPD